MANRRAQSRHRPSLGSQPGVFALTSETRSGSMALAETRSPAEIDRWQVGQWKGRSAGSEGAAGEEAWRDGMEWVGAFGLLVTLVWLYIEILRLLAKMQDRRR